MTCTYPQCETKTTPGIHLCAEHTRMLAELIGRAPEQVATARETVAKQGSNAGGGGAGGVSSAPINLSAMVRVDEYVRLLHAEPVLTLPDGAARAARSSWAGPHLAHLQRAEAAMMRACDPAVDWLVLGECGNVEGEAPCVGVYRYQAGWVRACCSKCDYDVAVAEYRSWQLRRVPLAPAGLTAVVRGLEALGVAVRLNTVQVWAHRGRLVPAAFDGQTPLYRAGDILDLLEGKPVAA